MVEYPTVSLAVERWAGKYKFERFFEVAVPYFWFRDMGVVVGLVVLFLIAGTVTADEFNDWMLRYGKKFAAEEYVGAFLKGFGQHFTDGVLLAFAVLTPPCQTADSENDILRQFGNH